jgi:CRISPR-associated protein Csx17
MSSRIELTGIKPVPLSQYLKALGVLRLVSEQLDPTVEGAWTGERFTLVSNDLTEEDLRGFFLEAYRPTPVINPWNGGSGFHRGDNDTAIKVLEQSKGRRVEEFRTTIAVAREVLVDLGIEEKPNKKQKADVLVEMRNRLPDTALRWMDAAVVLSDAGPAFPPILGTGGNDGRLEFSNNFMQRLLDVLDVDTDKAKEFAPALLRQSLFGDPVSGLQKSAIGQFNPGLAGGANAGQGYEGQSLVNPWDYLLMIEGALFFAATVTKRVQAFRDVGSFPFTVQSQTVGHPTLAPNDEHEARGEIWLPLWSRPAGSEEIAYLMSEGRAQVLDRPAKTALDFAKACALLGVDRGIVAFQRYAFLRRAGKSYFAVPVTRVKVDYRQNAYLLSELDAWLEEARKASVTLPQAFSEAIRAVDKASFDLCQSDNQPARLVQKVLIAAGRLERVISRSPTMQKAVAPLELSDQWINAADDGSHAYRIARAVSGLYGPAEKPFRVNLSPIVIKRSPNKRRSIAWDNEATSSVVFMPGRLADSLAAVLWRRIIESKTSTAPLATTESSSQSPGKPWRSKYVLRIDDVLSYVFDPQDDRIIEDLIWGMTLIKPPANTVIDQSSDSSDTDRPVPGALALLYLLFAPYLPWLEDRQIPIPEHLPGLLRAGRIPDAVALAQQRFRASGFPVPFPIQAISLPAERVTSSLILPLAYKDLERLWSQVGLATEGPLVVWR